MKQTSYPPVIIIGMHRSGTSMLMSMLEETGLFVGKKIDRHSEATFFFSINERLYQQSGAVWDNPHPFNQLLTDTNFRSYAVKYIRFLMKSPYAMSFLGLNRYLSHRTPENLDLPWGWKDPRNTYTLPLWLDIFPNAKIVHIYRHGVDVAQSLKKRHEGSLSYLKRVRSPKKLLYWLMLKKHPYFTLRCATLEGGISLWEEYLHQARVYVNKLQERAIEIKYEDFLAQPIEILKSLSHFCELPVTESDIKKVAGRVKKGRVYAYMSNPKLQQFAERVSDRLRLFGY